MRTRLGDDVVLMRWRETKFVDLKNHSRAFMRAKALCSMVGDLNAELLLLMPKQQLFPPTSSAGLAMSHVNTCLL